MEQKDARTIQAELARPFAPGDLEWRLQQTYDDKRTGEKRGIAVPFVTNRAIQARLDDVVGVDGWYNEYKPWHNAGTKAAQICGISICFPEKGFVTKWDGAEDSDIEPVKGGLSDSMKRAAVQWGIGRYLYDMDVVFVDVEQRGKSWVIPKSERPKLDKAYADTLSRLKQPVDKPAPAPRPQPAPVQPLPQPKSKADSAPNSAEYIVLAAEPRKCGNGVHTLVALRGRDGNTIRAFTVGQRSELVQGVQLSGVKLELQQQDTVVFYILRDYRVVVPQDQAA